MSKGRGRGRGGRADRQRDPIINPPVVLPPIEPGNGIRLVVGTGLQNLDILTQSSWGGRMADAEAAALAYGYDGGATEYFAFGLIQHHQFGPLVQVAYVMPNGQATSTLIRADYEVTFATDA